MNPVQLRRLDCVHAQGWRCPHTISGPFHLLSFLRLSQRHSPCLVDSVIPAITLISGIVGFSSFVIPSGGRGLCAWVRSHTHAAYKKRGTFFACCLTRGENLSTCQLMISAKSSLLSIKYFSCIYVVANISTRQECLLARLGMQFWMMQRDMVPRKKAI
jgi:hypothetical protein